MILVATFYLAVFVLAIFIEVQNKKKEPTWQERFDEIMKNDKPRWKQRFEEMQKMNN